MWTLWNKIYFIKNSFWKFYEVKSERGDFNWCWFWSSFDAVVVFVTSQTLLFRLALAIMCNGISCFIIWPPLVSQIFLDASSLTFPFFLQMSLIILRPVFDSSFFKYILSNHWWYLQNADLSLRVGRIRCIKEFASSHR